MYGITYIATNSCLQHSSWYSAQSSTEGTLPSTVIFVARLLYRLLSGMVVDTTAIFAWWQWGDHQTLRITNYRVCFCPNVCYMTCQSVTQMNRSNTLWTVRIVQLHVMYFFLHCSLVLSLTHIPFLNILRLSSSFTAKDHLHTRASKLRSWSSLCFVLQNCRHQKGSVHFLNACWIYLKAVHGISHRRGLFPSQDSADYC